MSERSMQHSGSICGGGSPRPQPRTKSKGVLFAGAFLVSCLVLPTVAMASDAFVCQELRSAVADAERDFASYKGALQTQSNPSGTPGRTYTARKSMTGAKVCIVVDVSLDEPKMRMRQMAYSCEFPGVSRLDKALRAQLTRCISGEVDDPSDPEDLTIWVHRVLSGEGYRGTEVNAQANTVNGLTLLVRLSVCKNQGPGRACEQ